MDLTTIGICKYAMTSAKKITDFVYLGWKFIPKRFTSSKIHTKDLYTPNSFSLNHIKIRLKKSYLNGLIKYQSALVIKQVNLGNCYSKSHRKSPNLILL